jgi:hypothetical protein
MPADKQGHRAKPYALTGGAGRDRTGDLLNANQALSQLSYSPFLGGGRWVVGGRN